MKIADATQALRDAAVTLAGMPLELATAIHAKTAGKAAHEVKADTWADLRSAAVDPDDMPELDEPMNALGAAIAAIRAALA